MTSPSDNATVTTVKKKLYIDWQNPPDVVATQGIYLVSGGDTPLCRDPNEAEFVIKLEKKLRFLRDSVQDWRRAKYHEAADEWPMGHTPPEVKEKSAAELKAQLEFYEFTSDDDGDRDDGGKYVVNAGIGPEKTVGQNPPDVVATQGIYLVPGGGTPILRDPNEAEFAIKLEKRLRFLRNTLQVMRRAEYHEAADEWPMGHTPPEVKEKFAAELKAGLEFSDFTSDDDGDRDDGDRDNGGKYVVNAGIGPEKTAAASAGSRKKSSQADQLPTPPLSGESPLATPHRRKRRRTSGDDEVQDEEKERPTKTRVSSAKEVPAADNTVPSTSQDKSRKRRRTLGVGDEENGDKECSTKGRITNNIGPRRLQKLRPKQSAR